MFILDNFPKNPEEVLMEIIRITCEAQNNKESLDDRFATPSAYAGFEITKYLWKLEVIKAIKENELGQMTLQDFMKGTENG